MSSWTDAIEDDELETIEASKLDAPTTAEALGRLRTKYGAHEYREAIKALCRAVPRDVLKAALNAAAQTTTKPQPTLHDISDGQLKDLVDKLFTEAMKPYQKLADVVTLFMPVVAQHHEQLTLPPVYLTTAEREWLRVVVDKQFDNGGDMATGVLTKLEENR